MKDKKLREIETIIANMHNGGLPHGMYVEHHLKPSEISLIIEALELLKTK